VYTYDPKTELEVAEAPVKSVNYGNKEERIWVSKHLLWALEEGYIVEVVPIDIETRNRK